jgi:hypothetical protein
VGANVADGSFGNKAGISYEIRGKTIESLAAINELEAAARDPKRRRAMLESYGGSEAARF